MKPSLKPALFAGLGVFIYLTVVDVIAMFVYSFPWRLDSLTSLGHSVSYGLGVFLILAFFTRIARDSTNLATIGGGALGAVAGGALTSVGVAILFLMTPPSLSMVGDLFDVVRGPLTAILAQLPLTVLAAVLVREWLRSRAVIDAPKEPVSAV